MACAFVFRLTRHLGSRSTLDIDPGRLAQLLLILGLISLLAGVWPVLGALVGLTGLLIGIVTYGARFANRAVRKATPDAA